MEIGCVAEALFGALFHGRLVFLALPEDFEVFAADVHASLVAVELVELVVAGFVLHGGVVDLEGGDEILGIFGSDNDGLRRFEAGAVGLTCGCRNGCWEGRVHQQVNSIIDMRALIGDDATGVISVLSPVAEAVGV